MNDLNLTMQKVAIYRIFKSKEFFRICAFLILLGTAWYIYFTFIDKTNSQDAILNQLIANNRQVDELKGEITKLKDSNIELAKSVCILQQQVESLGAVPVVEKNSDCVDNDSNAEE